VMVVFLNLTAVVNPNTHGGLFYIEPLAKHCLPGKLLDPEGNIAIAVGIVQAIVTMFMNKIFREVAVYATDRENHRTESDYNNSLIMKRFVFEFCDFFLYLLYIGLYTLNIRLLRTNLATLFMIDEIRRVLTETLIPYIMQNRQKLEKKAKKGLEKAKEKANKLSNKGQAKEEKKEQEETLANKNTQEYVDQKEMEEIEKDEYEIFDDYLEMIITFGYITLFASAFPLAATISVVFIYFEARSDIFKLEKTLKRPHVIKTVSIGSWQLVLEVMAFMSIFTNIVLFAYASD